MDFAITISRVDDQAVLVLRGSVDLASRDAVVTAGRNVLDESGTVALVLDLADVDFFDSSGVGALVTLAAACKVADVTFTIRSTSPPVARVLQISGLLGAWTAP